MEPGAHNPRTLAEIIAMVAGAVVLLWCLYLVRGILLLIYVSMVLAIGFSPIVRLIERQRLLPQGAQRVPRWMAILTLYIIILGTLTAIGIMIVPQLAEQARQLWTAAPAMVERSQDWLVNAKIIDHRLTLKEAFQQAPASGDAVGTLAGAVFGFLGGLFGLLTILILTFYFLVEAANLRSAFLQLFPRRQRHASRRPVAPQPSKSARGSTASCCSRRSSASRPRLASGCWACRTSMCWRSSPASAR